MVEPLWTGPGRRPGRTGSGDGALPDWATSLGLQGHPEGGWFAETWRSETSVDLPGYPASRSLGTSIYFLLCRERSPLAPGPVGRAVAPPPRLGAGLTLGGDGEHPSDEVRHRLGPDVANDESPQLLVPPGHWQAARLLGEEPVLVSCVVVPGFDFADFDPARSRVADARDSVSARLASKDQCGGGGQVADAFALQSRIAAAARDSGRPVIDAGWDSRTGPSPNRERRSSASACSPRRRRSTTAPPTSGARCRPWAGSTSGCSPASRRTTPDRHGHRSSAAPSSSRSASWVRPRRVGARAGAVGPGFGYPSPNRMQPHLEKVAERYVVRFTGSPLDDDHRFDVFATEGGAAAMTYIFTTLQVNGVVGPGDAVAVATPTYTPYLQIPVLERIGFDVVEIRAVAHQPYRFDEGALDCAARPTDQGVLPHQPRQPRQPSGETGAARGAAPHRRDRPARPARRQRHRLRDLRRELPRGHGGHPAQRDPPALFSKGYAATGNRLGFVAVHRDSVADRMLAGKSAEAKEELRARYQAASDDVDAMPFIQRMLADSRQVALHNIAGLATPDQVQMTLFELAYLMPEGAHYVEGVRARPQARLDALYAGLGVPPPAARTATTTGWSTS